MTAVIHEAYVQGISTRSVDELVKALGMTGISKSQVSRLCEEIDERVDEFLDRPIEGDWPYLWIDATCVKVRQSGRIVSVATIICGGGQHRRPARGARDGYGPIRGRAVLDGVPALADAPRTAWGEAGGLGRARGTEGDGVEGAERDVAALPGALCVFRPNVTGRSGNVTADFGIVTGRSGVVTDQLREKFPKLATMMEAAENEVLSFMDLPLVSTA